MKTLYKLDSSGKLRVLNIWTEGANVVQESGLIDGKLARTASLCSPKNLGKVNETTADEQAISEMESKIREKLKEEYFLSLEEAEKSAVVLPMLAKKYNDEKQKVIFPCFAQPKLDGMRCLGHPNKMISRKNTPIDTMRHIQEELSALGSSIILDGELYAHGLSFQENMRLIKKERPETITVKYHVYDLIADIPFELRYELLKEKVKGLEFVELVPTYVIHNEEELKKYHAQFLGEGYEGTIIRWGTQGYDINKRSSSLLKYKDFIDIALPIKDIRPSDVVPTQGFPVFYWKGAKNDELSAGMKFSHAEREEFLTNKENYIGLTAEIRFFEYSETGVPRFPVCVGFRLDK